MASLKIITKDEVAKHNKRKDMWVVVHGHVFNVTEWSENHPGGWEILLQNSGGFDAYLEFEQIKHSSDARKTMRNYLIGILEGNEGKKIPKEGEFALPGSKAGAPTFAMRNMDSKPKNIGSGGDDGSSMIMIAGGVVVGAAALAYYLFTKTRE